MGKLEMKSIIIVSDVHWGERSNFEEFLDWIANLTPTCPTEK